jgi:hypothetical protein
LPQNNLIVPLQLELCYLQNGKTVMNSIANFSKQPWNDGERDQNADYPYLGETVLAEAFQNDTFFLEAGLHIFWVLPRAFRSAKKNESGNRQSYPCVPNRWLINKLNSDKKPIRQWVVESDFLKDDNTSAENARAVNVPVPLEPKKQPYKFLGRQLTLESWRELPPPAAGTYWEDIFHTGLTALGYGEPSFSTLYTNCRSVFGCHENDTIDDSISYEVIGWYSNPEYDLIKGSQSIDDQKEIAKQYNWNVDWDSVSDPFSRCILYGSIPFSGTKDIIPPQIDNISVGYTGAEAVSAYIAQKISPELAKEKTEDTLEAILFGSKIEKGSIDSMPNFYEARHQKGFDGEDGGILWTLRNTSKKMDEAPAEINEGIAILLNKLNTRQDAYDTGSQALVALHFQLYSDWNKYIRACYPPLGEGFNFPDIDQIKALIEDELLNKIAPQKEKNGVLIIQETNDTYTVSASGESAEDSDARKVVETFDELTEKLKALMPGWDINRISSPRYYTPKDPVVVFAGDIEGFEYLNAAPLQEQNCRTKDLDIVSFIKQSEQAKQESIKVALSIPTEDRSFISSPAVWEPQVFQWLVEYFPVKKNSNEQSIINAYRPDYITSNFSLGVDQFDFEQNLENVSNGFQYGGSTYLSGSVRDRYMDTLKQFILKEDPDIDTDKFRESLIKWTEEHPDQRGKPIYIAMEAWLLLDAVFLISQSIGGFHEALLQQRNNINLPIIDPLGFDPYVGFTETIAQELRDIIVSAPLPAEQFIPIRAGAFKLRTLKLTDQFGKESFISISKHATISALFISPDTDVKWLPPRLPQPSRLNLRWISAKDDTVEANSLFNSSPVCGWTVVNYLNSDLIFYLDDGTQLGYYSIAGVWHSALGSAAPFTDADITAANPRNINVQLLSVLLFVKEQITRQPGDPNPFLKKLLDVIETAQDNIYPQSLSGQDASALLMSKPMALVRTKVGLQVKGIYRYDQSWNALSSNMNPPYDRTTDNYPAVKFPIRMGEQSQLDDGLIGFWIGGEDLGFKDDTFYANVTGTDAEGIVCDNQITKTLDEEADNLTLLMDPRAILHATTGILPVKTILIPSEHYVDALKKIEVDFLTAPVISSKMDVSITTPDTKDKVWEWWSKNESSAPSQETLSTFDMNGTFSEQKIKEGWLKLKNKPSPKKSL